MHTAKTIFVSIQGCDSEVMNNLIKQVYARCTIYSKRFLNLICFVLISRFLPFQFLSMKKVFQMNIWFLHSIYKLLFV